jgi:hypothetical protein
VLCLLTEVLSLLIRCIYFSCMLSYQLVTFIPLSTGFCIVFPAKYICFIHYFYWVIEERKGLLKQDEITIIFLPSFNDKVQKMYPLRCILQSKSWVSTQMRCELTQEVVNIFYSFRSGCMAMAYILYKKYLLTTVSSKLGCSIQLAFKTQKC